MPTVASERVLLLGGPASGKTTYLVQLHGRVAAGRGALRSRGAAASLAPIEHGYYQLQQGLAVAHTAEGTSVDLVLPVADDAGRAIDVAVPDYAGEDLVRVALERSVSARWLLESACDQWVLFVRAGRHGIAPDVLARPIGELAWNAVEADTHEIDELPGDLWAVETLQALLHARQIDQPTKPGLPSLSGLPSLTVALSCWDELDLPDGTSPEQVLDERMPLLHSYCRNTWADRHRTLGLSAQGRILGEEPDEDYIDLGPESMGWVVAADGSREPDLTVLVERW